MCKQDVQIGRAATSRTVRVTITAGTMTKLLGGNGGRIALAVFVEGSVTGPYVGAVGVGMNNGVAPTALLGVSGNTPFARQTIDRAGTDLTGDIWGLAQGTTDATIVVTETYLMESLDAV